MRQLILVTILILFTFISSFAQDNRHSGISLESSTLNKSVYKEGEPIFITLIFKNNLDSEVPVWKPLFGVNTKFELYKKNRTNELTSDSSPIFNTFRDMRDRIKNSTPNSPYSYAKEEVVIYEFEFGEVFKSLLTYNIENDLPFTSGGQALTVIEPGNYTLKVTYYIFPTSGINSFITIDIPIEIKKLDANEALAYEAFKKALAYTSQNSLFYDDNYNPSNPNSLEIFIEKYPNSIYTRYAYYYLIREIYEYYNTLPETTKDKFISRWIDEESPSNLVFKKANLILDILGKSISKNSRTRAYATLESQLEILKNDNPELSDIFILNAKRKYKIDGLKNRACE